MRCLQTVRDPTISSTMPETGREIEQARGIDRDVFCAGCAYNLRTRSLVGRCSECGGEYDCRPLRLRGILLPQDLTFPFGQFAWGIACATGGLLMVYAATVQPVRWAFWLGIALALCAPFFLLAAGRRAVKIIRLRGLIRTARRNETITDD